VLAQKVGKECLGRFAHHDLAAAMLASGRKGKSDNAKSDKAVIAGDMASGAGMTSP
jgi:hypothetical protein